MRMRQYCENALTVAKFLESSDKIASVRYPALPGNEHYERAQKYLPMGTSGVMSIDIKGGRAPAMKFMDSSSWRAMRFTLRHPHLRAASGVRNPPSADR